MNPTDYQPLATVGRLAQALVSCGMAVLDLDADDSEGVPDVFTEARAKLPDLTK